MVDKNEELIPQKQSLFELKADDILDNALQNLDDKQVRDVTKKAADEVIRIAVEKRKAEMRSTSAQDEMRNLVHNANLLDQRGGDYEINSTFETATGTTQVQIRRSKSNTLILIASAVGLALAVLLLILLFTR